MPMAGVSVQRPNRSAWGDPLACDIVASTNPIRDAREKEGYRLKDNCARTREPEGGCPDTSLENHLRHLEVDAHLDYQDLERRLAAVERRLEELTDPRDLGDGREYVRR